MGIREGWGSGRDTKGGKGGGKGGGGGGGNGEGNGGGNARCSPCCSCVMSCVALYRLWVRIKTGGILVLVLLPFFFM